MKLTTDAELAEHFGIEVDELHDLRKRQGWPHVRLSRFVVRFTDAQVAQIVAMRSVEGAKSIAGETGLTERSARTA